MDSMAREPKRVVDKYYANIYSSLPVVLFKGKGIYVWDIKGKKYFDCLSCYSAVNQGHRHPKIIKAAKKQMNRITLTSMAFYNDKLGEFLEILNSTTGLPKVILKNSGAEGVETAIKTMRLWGRKAKLVNSPKIIVMDNNFHGRTTTIVGFSSDQKTKEDFGPYCDGFISVPYGDIDAFKQALDDPTVVGALVEPIQGEAGVIIPPDNYLYEVYLACKNRKVLLALDEIQTGLGRTGTLFAHRGIDLRFYDKGNRLVTIKPDILILGKALSGGVYPISACCMTQEVGELFEHGTDGSTYGGNPLAAAIGKASLEVILEEELSTNSKRQGDQLYYGLLNVTRNNKHIKELRGRGLFVAVEFHEPVAKLACSKLMDKGILAKDTHGTTIRFAPPLVITRPEVNELLDRLEDFFYEFTY